MRVYVESYGCSQNLGEGDALARAIHGAGHALAADPSEADAGVLVTCGVIGATEARMLRRWRSLARSLPRVVVTGCLVPLRSELFDGPERDRTDLVPTREQATIPARLGAPAPVPAALGAKGPGADGRATREIVLAQGCTSHCTYCYSRLARGRLASRPMAEVLDRVEEARASGAVEIRLSSLDTSCWGEDRPGGPRLPELLDALGGRERPFRVRVGMMSPQSLGPIAGPYFRALARAPAFAFLHLPVQSGSDAVLGAMRRGYGVGEVRRLVGAARRALPDLVLATDVIIGFPTESEEDFAATLALLEELAPEIVNVTRFSPRPLTPAALLPPLPSSVVKRRSRRATDARQRLARARLERWIGRTLPAWVVETGTGASRVARLENYLPVVLPGPGPVGVRTAVRIDGARSTYLIGREIADGDPLARPC